MTTLAILHPTHLVAQELRQRLGEDRQGWQEILLLSTEEDEIGTLTEVGGGAALIQPYRRETLEGVDLVFLCGPMAANRRILEELPAATRAVLLSPDAGLEDGVLLVEGVNLEGAPQGKVLVSPHPGAVHLAHLLHPLRELGLARAVATLLQPASLLGSSALDELMEQARGLLTFQPVRASDSLPHQLAFNLLPADLPAETISRQLEAVMGQGIALAAQVLQAGVFHSNSATLYFELAPDPGPEAVHQALASQAMLEVRTAEDPPLGPVEAASSEQILVGHLHPAGQSPGGYWLWSAMDNLTRGAALNALAIARAALV